MGVIIMPTRHEVCWVEDLQPGEREMVEVEGLSIGVFNVDGEYHAIANVCPHQLAPLCLGKVTGEMTAEKVGDFQLIREGEIIQCPWHGWKFDIRDGTSVFNPHALKTRTFDVEVETKPAEEVEQIEEFGTALRGDEPPVDTYPVEVEEEVVVLYV